MRRILLFMLLSVCSVARSQDIKPGLAADIAQGGDHGVDHATGTLHYTLPLLSAEQDGYTVPVSISYTARGVKVRQKDSRVGIGWQLNAGGVVARTLKGGLCDESNKGHLYNPVPDDVGEYQKSVNSKRIDGESDIFTAQFGGESVCFIIKQDLVNDAVTIIPSERTNVKIECLCRGSVLNKNVEIKGFKITDTNGVVYYFKDIEYTLNAHYPHHILRDLKHIEKYPSAWYLSKIELPTGSEITFSYTKGIPEYFGEAGSYEYVYGKPWEEWVTVVRDPFHLQSDNYDYLMQNKSIQYFVSRLNHDLSDIMNGSPDDLNKVFDDVVATNMDPFSDRQDSISVASLLKVAEYESIIESIICDELCESYSNMPESSSNIAKAKKELVCNRFSYDAEIDVTERLYRLKCEGSPGCIILPLMLNRISGTDFVIDFDSYTEDIMCYKDFVNTYRSKYGRIVKREGKNEITKVVKFDYIDGPDWNTHFLKSLRCNNGEELFDLAYNFNYYNEEMKYNGNYMEDYFGYCRECSDLDGIDDLKEFASWLREQTHSVFDMLFRSFYGEGLLKAINVDQKNVKNSSLKSIEFPAGGAIEFDYESNTISSVKHGLQYVKPGYTVGGLRIKKISVNDGNGNVQTTQYNYDLENNGLGRLSSGYLDPTGLVVYKETVDYGDFSDLIVRNDGVTNHKFMFKPGNNGVWYSCVEEIQNGKGKTIYTYPPGNSLDDDGVYPEVGGILLGKYHFTEENELIQMERFRYGIDELRYQHLLHCMPDASMYFEALPSDGIVDVNVEPYSYCLKELSEYELDDKYPDREFIKCREGVFTILFNPREDYEHNMRPRLHPKLPDDLIYQIGLQQDCRLTEKEVIGFKGIKMDVFDQNSLPCRIDEAHPDLVTTSSKEKYYYDLPGYNLITRTETQKSNGQKQISRYKYPVSYDLDQNHPISLLVAQNSISQPIEKQVWQTDGQTEQLLASEITEYGVVSKESKQFIVPAANYRLRAGSVLTGGGSSLPECLNITSGFSSLFPCSESLYQKTASMISGFTGGRLRLKEEEGTDRIKTAKKWDYKNGKISLEATNVESKQVDCINFLSFENLSLFWKLDLNFNHGPFVKLLQGFGVDASDPYGFLNQFLDEYDDGFLADFPNVKCYPVMQKAHDLAYSILFNDDYDRVLKQASELRDKLENSGLPPLGPDDKYIVMILHLDFLSHSLVHNFGDHNGPETYRYFSSYNGWHGMIEEHKGLYLKCDVSEMIKRNEQLRFAATARFVTEGQHSIYAEYRGEYEDGTFTPWYDIELDFYGGKWEVASVLLDHSVFADLNRVKSIEVDLNCFVWIEECEFGSALLTPDECQFTAFSYDYHGRLMCQIDSNYELTSYEYSSGNNLDLLRDGNGNIVEKYVLNKRGKPFLEVPIAGVRLDAYAGSRIIMIESSKPCDIQVTSESGDWLQLDKNSGKGRIELTINYPDLLIDERSALIVVTDGTSTKEIKVTQSHEYSTIQTCAEEIVLSEDMNKAIFMVYEDDWDFSYSGTSCVTVTRKDLGCEDVLYVQFNPCKDSFANNPDGIYMGTITINHKGRSKKIDITYER